MTDRDVHRPSSEGDKLGLYYRKTKAGRFPVFFFLCTGFSFLLSCDPARILVVKSNGIDSKVSIYVNRGLGSRSDPRSGKAVITNPYSIPRKRDTMFYFGTGGWYDEDIVELVKCIDSVVFLNNAGKMIISTDEQKKYFLLQSRQGLSGSKIVIDPQQTNTADKERSTEKSP